VQTVTTYETKHKTENKQVTTYVPTSKMAALAAPTCNPDRAISSLGDLATGNLATACSCIGHPARTTTVTTIINAQPVNTLLTSFVGTAPTTTIYNIALSTTTVTRNPVKFITQTTTECTTSTSVLTYAAPEYTQAFGPKAGCVDKNVASSKILPHSTSSMESATQQCKDLCTQDAACKAVYVQHMSFVRGGPKHYHCFFNAERLDVEADLECSHKIKKEIYGQAIGFDACERGTEAL
jgi:hypothetical protein